MPYAPKSNSVPAGEVTEMIQCMQICFIMHHGYHHNCVNLTIEKVKKYKGILDVSSSHDGCNDAFTDTCIQF